MARDKHLPHAHAAYIDLPKRSLKLIGGWLGAVCLLCFVLAFVAPVLIQSLLNLGVKSRFAAVSTTRVCLAWPMHQ